jgi:protein-disulfide reductase (glutathione)
LNSNNYNFSKLVKDDEDEPKEKSFGPDGLYIPRIFFIAPTGQVRHDIVADNGKPNYKYFYANDDQGF